MQLTEKQGEISSQETIEKTEDMETSLEHLPDQKQKELKAIAQVICQSFAVEMIILFGSYARGDWVEEYSDDGIHIQYQSDFDLLVVVETRSISEQTHLEQKIKKAIKELPIYYTPVSILVHDIKFINRRLMRSQYFFLDIKKEGIVLFDSGKFALALPKELSHHQRYHLAKEDFNYWFNGAKDFYEVFNFCFEKNKYNKAAFELHQITEQLYNCILLVFTRYKPKTHDLEELRSFVNTLDQRFIRVFSLAIPEENRLFNLLCKAYVDARYNKNYRITQDELSWLAKKVQELTHLTEMLCQEKINGFLEAAKSESQNQNDIA